MPPPPAPQPEPTADAAAEDSATADAAPQPAAAEQGDETALHGGPLEGTQSRELSPLDSNDLSPGHCVQLSPRGKEAEMYNWDADPVQPGEVGRVEYDAAGEWRKEDENDGLLVHVTGPRGEGDWYQVDHLERSQETRPRPLPQPRAPRVGDRVVSRYGQPCDDEEGGWTLGPLEEATVIEVDEEGDVRLRNSKGEDSSYWKLSTHLRLAEGGLLCPPPGSRRASSTDDGLGGSVQLIDGGALGDAAPASSGTPGGSFGHLEGSMVTMPMELQSAKQRKAGGV